MQNKGAINLFAILLGLACIFYLSFTWVTRSVEADADAYGVSMAGKATVTQAAKDYAAGDGSKEKAYTDSVKGIYTTSYLDSMKNQTVYDIGITKYTYEQAKGKEINLGLDLRGGINVTLELSVGDIIRGLSNNNPNPQFNQALSETQRDLGVENNKDFVSLFADKYTKLAPAGRLAPLFQTMENKGKIDYNASNAQVLEYIKERVNEAVDNAKKTYRSRIDRFGVTQPNIQQLEASGRILIELPGVQDKDRVRKLLQGTANLEFWETYENAEMVNNFFEANKKVKNFLNPKGAVDTLITDSTKVDSLAKAVDKSKWSKAELAKYIADSTAKAVAAASAKKDSTLEEKMAAAKAKTDKTEKKDTSLAAYRLENPFFSQVGPLIPMLGQNEQKQTIAYPGAVVGRARIKDTALVNKYLALPSVRGLFPNKVKFLWDAKADKGTDVLNLYAIKITDRNGKPALYGDIIASAEKQIENGQIVISMNMTPDAAQKWKRLTAANAPQNPQDPNARGRCIAIVMDGLVYSAPTVNGEIPNGSSQISGNFDNAEADALVAILSAGKLPATARIVQSTIVGPTLGAEAIHDGLISFLIAFLVILIFMAFYYNKAGWVANLALLINLFFVMGVLVSLGAVLTLPGIAGIVLTIGLSVDANILIFERIREELALGKTVSQSIKEGFKHAMSSIIDSNVTLLILGIILYVFGSGPVQGFATTLCVGILSSLFAAVLLSRVIFDTLLNRKVNMTFDNNMTRSAFKNIAFNFVGRRKLYYTISAAVIILGAVFYFKNGGLNLGVDFKGGRTYIVRFDKEMKTEDVKAKLTEAFEKEAPEVKTAGSASQLKITTSYRIADQDEQADKQVEELLDKGLSSTGAKFEVVSQQKVGPAIATDIVYGAYGAILFSCLVMFIYIVIRFKKWQYGLGAVIALFHDALVVLSCYTIFDGLLPFSLEIGQDFIAAILTVMGYTMTETVVVFDRIRERLAESGKSDMFGEERNKLINFALNSTLSRTILTSLTVFFVLLVIFIFGGDSIRGFIFALLIGRIIGTYSSLCISTPIVVDFDRKKTA
jgi:SecD/SecF fusion protein